MALDLSVVIPLFNEEPNVGELYRELSKTLTDWHGTYEIILVDDGSTDDKGQVTDIPSGNFAQVTAGYRHSCGLRPTGEVECWGRNDDDIITGAPSGAFTLIAAGSQNNCGAS